MDEPAPPLYLEAEGAARAEVCRVVWATVAGAGRAAVMGFQPGVRPPVPTVTPRDYRFVERGWSCRQDGKRCRIMMTHTIPK
jgi:hypothetical protein